MWTIIIFLIDWCCYFQKLYHLKLLYSDIRKLCVDNWVIICHPDIIIRQLSKHKIIYTFLKVLFKPLCRITNVIYLGSPHKIIQKCCFQWNAYFVQPATSIYLPHITPNWQYNIFNFSWLNFEITHRLNFTIIWTTRF